VVPTTVVPTTTTTVRSKPAAAPKVATAKGLPSNFFGAPLPPKSTVTTPQKPPPPPQSQQSQQSQPPPPPQQGDLQGTKSFTPRPAEPARTRPARPNIVVQTPPRPVFIEAAAAAADDDDEAEAERLLAEEAAALGVDVAVAAQQREAKMLHRTADDLLGHAVAALRVSHGHTRDCRGGPGATTATRYQHHHLAPQAASEGSWLLSSPPPAPHRMRCIGPTQARRGAAGDADAR